MGSSLRQDDQGEDVDDDDEEEGDVVDDDVDEGGDEDGDKDGDEDGDEDGGEDAGEDGDDVVMLSARAPSRSFSLIESTHASIPRMNNMRVAKEMLDSPHMLMRCKLCSRPAR